jgi:hypothetical protein
MNAIQAADVVRPAIYILAGLIFLYLFRIDQLLKGTPDEIRKLAGSSWTPELLKKTYERLSRESIDYTGQLPGRQQRRYVVTGGNGDVRDLNQS